MNASCHPKRLGDLDARPGFPVSDSASNPSEAYLPPTCRHAHLRPSSDATQDIDISTSPSPSGVGFIPFAPSLQLTHSRIPKTGRLHALGLDPTTSRRSAPVERRISSTLCVSERFLATFPGASQARSPNFLFGELEPWGKRPTAPSDLNP